MAQQTINGEPLSDEDRTFLDPDEQTTNTQTSDQEQGEEEETPQTPQEARDAALAALTPEQARDYRQRSAYASAAGFPTPPPPGYQEPTPAPVDAAAQAEQDAATAADLEAKIAEAEKAGNWQASMAWKGQLLNLARQQNSRRAATYGWQGPGR